MGSSRLRGDGLDRRAPVPRQEFLKPASRVSGNARQHVREPGQRIDAVHLCGDDQTVHGRRPLAAAIGAAEEPGLPAKGDAAQPALCRIVGEANASVVEKQREGVPALEHVLDRLDEIVSARQFGRFFAHVELKIVDQRAARYFSNSRTFRRAFAVDCALDRKQRVHTAHHLDGDRREWDFLFTRRFAPRILLDVGQDIEFAPGVGPACGFRRQMV